MLTKAGMQQLSRAEYFTASSPTDFAFVLSGALYIAIAICYYASGVGVLVACASCIER